MSGPRDRERARETERDRESQNRPYHTRTSVCERTWGHGSACAGEVVCVMCAVACVVSDRDREGERDGEGQRETERVETSLIRPG